MGDVKLGLVGGINRIVKHLGQIVASFDIGVVVAVVGCVIPAAFEYL